MIAPVGRTAWRLTARLGLRLLLVFFIAAWLSHATGALLWMGFLILWLAAEQLVSVPRIAAASEEPALGLRNPLFDQESE